MTGAQCIVSYSLKKHIQKFGDTGKNTTLKEMRQLHNIGCFQPIQKTSLNATEKKIVLESLIFLTKKCDSTFKAHQGPTLC